MGWSVGLIASARQHRGVILYGADVARMIWPILNGSFEDHALVVAFALALRLDAVAASWSLLAALDPAFSTSEAASLGTFPHLVC